MNELDTIFQKSADELSQSTESLMEACDELLPVFMQCDRTCVEAQVLANSIVRDYNLNLKQCALKCFQEDGTSDDMAFYEDRASQGAIGKLKSVIDKVIMIWKDIVRQIHARVTSKICSAGAKHAVKKMKKTLDQNPGLRNIKVSAPDITTALSVISKYRGLCNVENAQYVKSLTGKTKVKSIGGLIDDFKKSFDKAIVGKAAVCTVTLGGLILAIEAEMDKLPSIIKEIDLKESTILERLSATVSYDTEVGGIAALQQATNFRVQLGKQELETHCQYLHDMVQKAKEAINTGITGKAPINNNVVEDADGAQMQTVAEYFGEEESELFDEGANLDARSIFKIMKSEYKKELAAIKKCKKDGKYKEAITRCKKVEKLLDDTEKSIRSLDVTVGSAVLGFIAHNLIVFAKLTVVVFAAMGIGGAVGAGAGLIGGADAAIVGGMTGASLTTSISGVATYIASLVDLIKQIVGIVDRIRDLKPEDSSVTAFDMYINTFIQTISTMRSCITGLERVCESLDKTDIQSEEAAEDFEDANLSDIVSLGVDYTESADAAEMDIAAMVDAIFG